MGGRRTKRGSAGDRRTKRGSAGGRRTKEGSVGGRKTKRGSAKGKSTDILVCFLAFGYASFRFGCSLLMFLLPLQSPIFFSGIFFILVVLNRSNSFRNGTVIPVQTGRPCMESPVRVKLSIKGTVF